MIRRAPPWPAGCSMQPRSAACSASVWPTAVPSFSRRISPTGSGRSCGPSSASRAPWRTGASRARPLLAEPVAVGVGWATMESLLPDPGPGLLLDDENPWTDRVPAWSASSARPAGWTSDDLDLHPFRIADGELYPTPHNPIFDLHGTGAGADGSTPGPAGRGRSGRPPRCHPVIAYLDWSARNVRLDRTGIVAVYDWDSVAVASEAVAAGQAAATWRSTGETPDAPAPDADEIERFLVSFARARGRALLDTRERGCPRRRGVGHGLHGPLRARTRTTHALAQEPCPRLAAHPGRLLLA